MVLEPVVRPVLNPIIRAVQGFMDGVFSPAILFTSGEQGAWYDPSDINVNWRYNLLTYTEQFDNAVWTKSAATVTANATTAPDGTTTADALIENTTNTTHFTYQVLTRAAGIATYSYSFYFKSFSSNRLVRLIISDSVTANYSAAFVNPDTGAASSVINVGFTSGTISVTSVGNGWYRGVLTATTDAVSTGIVGQALLSLANQTTSYTGDGTSGAFIWGAQLQTGSVATTYQQIVTPEISYLSYQANPILYQDSAGTTPVTAVEQPVGLMLDKSKGLVLGSELRGTGAVDLVGTATAATYNTSTGNGSASRVDVSNQSSVVFGSLTANTFYVVDIANTSANQIAVRSSGVAGSIAHTVAANSSTKVYVSSGAGAAIYITANTSGTTVTFTISSVKALPGNHAFQTTSTSRPTLRARYNLLTYSEQFDNAAWNKSRLNTTGTPPWINVAVAPNGTTTADKLIEDTTPSNTHSINQVFTGAAVNHAFSVYAKAAERSQIRMRLFNGSIFVNETYFDLAAGTVVSGTGGTITNEGNGWYRCSISATLAAASCQAQIFLAVSGSDSYTGDGTSGIFVWGAQLLTAADVTATGNAYQHIAAATSYDTSNPVFRPYLAFDGSDDSMLTNSVDFSATDKMTVWAGVTKLSDAATGMFVELSASLAANNGAIYLAAPVVAASPDYQLASKGTTATSATSTLFPAPVTNVISGQTDIAAPSIILRANGSQVATQSSTQGTGNYGNYPLYIGRRGNVSLPFNGRTYSLIVRGAQSTAAQISSTESWVNQRTGAAAP